MTDWTTVTTNVISGFAWLTAYRAHRLATRVQEDNRERQDRLENYEFYPRIYVDLRTDDSGNISAVIRNESTQLLCRAGSIQAELKLYHGPVNVNDREVVEVDRVDADSTHFEALAKLSTRIKNAVPSIRQDTPENFPDGKGQFSIRIVFRFEGPVSDSRERCSYATFFLQLNRDNTFAVLQREER